MTVNKPVTLSGNPRALELFQKGVLLSIRALQSLYLYLNEKHEIKFILTHRLNQNGLESFFGTVRLNEGANDHPSALEALNRIRWIIMGRNLSNIAENTNTDDNTTDEFITQAILKRTKITVENEKSQPDENFTEIEAIEIKDSPGFFYYIKIFHISHF